MRRVVAGIVAISAVSACSLLTDTDLVGGGGGSGPDGATASDAPSTIDVASSADGAANPEAASDGATGPCGAGGAGAAFCENFDDPGFDARWKDPGYDIDGGTIELSELDAISKPKSLISRVPSGAKTCAGANVGKIFVGSFTTVKATVELWRDGADGTYVMLALGNNGRCDAYVNSDQGRWSVYFYDQDGVERYEQANLALPLVKTWTHVALEADFSAKQLRISHDGQTTTVPMGTCSVGSGDAYVQLGFACERPSGAAREVRFDDLAVESR